MFYDCVLLSPLISSEQSIFPYPFVPAEPSCLKKSGQRNFMAVFFYLLPHLPGRSFFPSPFIPAESSRFKKKAGEDILQPNFSPAKLSAMIFCSYSLPHFLQPTAGRFRSIDLPAAGVPVSFPKRRSPICGESANRELIFPKSKACLQRPVILYFSLSASRRRASSLENTQPQ